MSDWARNISAASAVLVASILTVVVPPAQAHGGLSLDKDVCKLVAGPYSMHFTGYQPDNSGGTEFCEDIPATGQTVIVLDAIEVELRQLPIEVTIVKDMGESADATAPPVLHIPPTLYKTGTVSFDYKFDSPGKFVGKVAIGEKGEFVSTFPFSVAAKKSGLGMYLVAALVILVGSALYVYAGRAREFSKAKKTLAETHEVQ